MPSTYKDPSIARIPLSLRSHIPTIALRASIIIFTGGILPLIGYLILHYATTFNTTYIITIFTLIFGFSSLYTLLVRTRALSRQTSTCRPLGSTSVWNLDYFNWNFITGFVILAVLIAIGISRDTPTNVRITSLPLSILMLLVCGQLVLFIPLRALGLRAPFRFSSIERGDPLKPAVYIIAEDVVAVDGRQGDAFRAQWKARYETSAPFRQLLARLDWWWGISGVVVAAAVIGIVLGVEEAAVGWAVGKFYLSILTTPLPPSTIPKGERKEEEWRRGKECPLISTAKNTGWSVPWIWAALMTLLTIEMTKRTCEREDQLSSLFSNSEP